MSPYLLELELLWGLEMKKIRFIHFRYLALVLCFSMFTTFNVVQAVDFKEFPEANELIDEIVDEHGLSRNRVTAIVTDANYQESIIKAITRPAEKLPWYRYRTIFISNSSIDRGVKFWNQHADILQRAENEYGVDASVIVAIIGIETRYGTYMGKHRIIDSLLTLTLGYPRRSEFFKKEFIEFLKLSQEEKLDPFTAKGSYAGAMGIPQFISSSYRHFAVDFNANGQKDLLTEVDDAIGSVANYLKVHGWQHKAPIYDELKAPNLATLDRLKTKSLKPDRTYQELNESGITFASLQAPAENEKLGVVKLESNLDTFVYNAGFENFYVITKYNRSSLYATAVAELAALISASRIGG